MPLKSIVLVEGDAGTGKSTVGLQFICEGALKYQEPGVYVSLEELPDDIYRNAAQFGYDMRQLELDGLVRVIGCSPDLLFEQIHGADGYLQNIVKEIRAKRMVIDSLNLVHLRESVASERMDLYSLFQALRRLALTVLMIRESTGESEDASIEQFVCDGIIRLENKEHSDTFISRTLRVKKMRRNEFDAREYIFRISSSGIYVASPLGTLPRQEHSYWSTHKEQLEHILSQVLVTGSVTLFDIGSLVNLLPVKKAVMMHRVGHGDTEFIWSLSASTTIKTFLNLSPKIKELFSNGNIRFIEHFRRAHDFHEHPNILDASKFSLVEYRNFLLDKFVTPMAKKASSRAQWLLCYDLNDVHHFHGTESIIQMLPEITAYEKDLELTTVIFVNLNEISSTVRAMLERSSDHIVHIWEEKGYQYLQVVKGRFEWSTRPFIMETHSELMDLGLV